MVKMLETFVPAFKSANDSFLTKMSIVMEKKSECRTYIAFDHETSKIMGFFSICFRYSAVTSAGMLRSGAVRIGPSLRIREAVRRTAQLHERLLGRRTAVFECHIRRSGKVLRSRPPDLISSVLDEQ